MPLMGIYAIVNLANGKRYIGSSTNIFKRWNDHIRNLDSKIHHSYKLQEDWLKHPITDFAFQILEVVHDKNKLLSIEQSYLDNESFENLYNVMSHTNYKAISIPTEFEENSTYCLTIPEDTKLKLKANINIYKKKGYGNLAKLGNKPNDLSKSWFSKNSRQVKQLSNNISNYFINILDAKTKDNAWTTFTQYYRTMATRGKVKSFVPMNGKITGNKRNNLCFAANCFPNSFISRELEKNTNVNINENVYALSILLKWIENVADIDKPINIYIPSNRMENLLVKWLNTQGEFYFDLCR